MAISVFCGSGEPRFSRFLAIFQRISCVPALWNLSSGPGRRRTHPEARYLVEGIGGPIRCRPSGF